jgi:hypothetical protein
VSGVVGGRPSMSELYGTYEVVDGSAGRQERAVEDRMT